MYSMFKKIWNKKNQKLNPYLNNAFLIFNNKIKFQKIKNNITIKSNFFFFCRIFLKFFF